MTRAHSPVSRFKLTHRQRRTHFILSLLPAPVTRAYSTRLFNLRACLLTCILHALSSLVYATVAGLRNTYMMRVDIEKRPRERERKRVWPGGMKRMREKAGGKCVRDRARAITHEGAQIYCRLPGDVEFSYQQFIIKFIFNYLFVIFISMRYFSFFFFFNYFISNYLITSFISKPF